MSATSIFILGIVAAAVLAAVGIFTIAVRRGPTAGPVTGSLDRRAVKKDRQRSQMVAEGAVATIVATEVDTDLVADPVPVDDSEGVAPIVQRQPVTAAEFGVYGPEGEWLIEGHGVEPDVVVDIPPHATFRGEDAQLQAAIEHLEQLIGSDPRPLPSAPPYPDKSARD